MSLLQLPNSSVLSAAQFEDYKNCLASFESSVIHWCPLSTLMGFNKGPSFYSVVTQRKETQKKKTVSVFLPL